MLTMFTTPKAFRGHFGVIQRNALRSWMLLRPSCDVIVFGDEEGTAEAAAELGCRHVSDVPRNEFGMPSIKGLFQDAQRLATTPFLAYANADIILMDDFTVAVRRLASLAERFLMSGQRHELEVREALAFGHAWDTQLRHRVIEYGADLAIGMDYFVFPRQLWGEIPNTLAVGRAGWDNWPLYAARLHKAIVVDATPVVMAVHQTHDYSHHPQGMRGVYRSVESRRNYATLGGARNVFTMLDATHLLTDEGLRIRCRSCYPLCVCKPVSF